MSDKWDVTVFDLKYFLKSEIKTYYSYKLANLCYIQFILFGNKEITL